MMTMKRVMGVGRCLRETTDDENQSEDDEDQDGG